MKKLTEEQVRSLRIGREVALGSCGKIGEEHKMSTKKEIERERQQIKIKTETD